MKKLALILSLVLAFAVNAVAQPKELSKEDKERIFNGKAQMMQKKLKLSEEQMKNFLPLYKEYQEEIAKVERPKRIAGKPESWTHDQAYEAAVSRLEYSESILKVQKKSLDKMKSVLSPQQLMRFCDAEKSVQKNIRDHKNMRKQRQDSLKKYKMVGKHKGFPRGKDMPFRGGDHEKGADEKSVD